MSDEPTERDVVKVAQVITASLSGRRWREMTPLHFARAVLASDWYAERIAQARREGAAEALDKAAEVGTPGPSIVCRSPKDRDDQWRKLLRDRAAALRDAP